MPPFIQVRQPPDDSWILFDLNPFAPPQVIQVRQPGDDRWQAFTIGGLAGGKFVREFPTIAAMATDTTLVVNDVCVCVDPGLTFNIVAAAEAPIRNVVVNSAIAGLQCHQDTTPGVVYFGPPRGGTNDDWPDLRDIIWREGAGQRRIIEFLPSSDPYIAATLWNLPGVPMTILGTPDGRIVCDLQTTPWNSGGAPFRSFQVVEGTAVLGTAAVTADAARGASVLQVDSITDPVIAVGTIIGVGQGFTEQTGTLTVIGITANGGNFDLSLDRRLQIGVTAGKVVTVEKSGIDGRANDCLLDGRGMTITGPTNRYFSLPNSDNMVVQNWRFDDSEGAVADLECGSFDLGGRHNTVRHIVGSFPTHGIGTLWRIENNYCSVAEDIEADRVSSIGVSLWSGVACAARRIVCTSMATGATGVMVGCPQVHCQDPLVEDCYFESAVADVYGIQASKYSTAFNIERMRIENVRTALHTGMYFPDALIDPVVAHCSAYMPNGCIYGIRKQASTDSMRIVDYVATGAARSPSLNQIAIYSGDSDLRIDGLSVNTAQAVILSTTAGHKLRVRNARVDNGGLALTSARHFQVSGTANAADVEMQNVRVVNSAAGEYLVSLFQGGRCVLEDCAINSGNLVNANAATASVRLVGKMTGTVTTAKVNRGTVQLNGAAAVAVAFPDIVANDVPRLTLLTRAGTYGGAPNVAITPGTGFTVTGQALDTSSYAWEVP